MLFSDLLIICNMGRNWSKEMNLFFKSESEGPPRILVISRLVGFWPRARQTSPKAFKGMASLPVLSKRLKVWWNSDFWSLV